MYRVLQYHAVAFVPIVTAATATAVYVNSQSCEPTSVTHFQYQAKAEPVFVPSAGGPETITQDKWDRGQSQPVFRIRRTTEFTAYVTDHSNLLRPERSTLDKWVVRIEQPRQDLRRTQWGYASFVGEKLNEVPTPAATTPLYVSSQSCEPISITHFQYQGVAKPVFTSPAAPETVSPDKWLSLWPQPRSTQRRLVHYGTNTAIAEQSEGGLAPVYWLRQTQIPVQTARGGVNHVFVQPISTASETVRLDKWVPQTQRPRFDRKRNQFSFPAFMADARLHISSAAEVVGLDRWGKNYPDQIFRPRRLADYGSLSIDATLRTERASLDKWAQPQSEPHRTIRRQQYVFPVIAADNLSQIPGAEVIGIDKWLARPYERFAQTRLPAVDFIASPVVNPTGLFRIGWHQPQGVPVRTLKRLQNLYPQLAIDAAFWLAPSTADSPAYDRDFGIIALDMEDSGSLTLLTNDVRATELQTNNVGTIAILTENFGVLD